MLGLLSVEHRVELVMCSLEKSSCVKPASCSAKCWNPSRIWYSISLSIGLVMFLKAMAGVYLHSSCCQYVLEYTLSFQASNSNTHCNQDIVCHPCHGVRIRLKIQHCFHSQYVPSITWRHNPDFPHYRVFKHPIKLSGAHGFRLPPRLQRSAPRDAVNARTWVFCIPSTRAIVSGAPSM